MNGLVSDVLSIVSNVMSTAWCLSGCLESSV